MTNTTIKLFNGNDQTNLHSYLLEGITADGVDNGDGTTDYTITNAADLQTISERLKAMNQGGYLYDTNKNLGDDQGEAWLTLDEATAIKTQWENSKVGPHSEKIVPAAFNGASKALRNILAKAGLVRGVDESSRKREAGQVHRNLTTRMPYNFYRDKTDPREVQFLDRDGDRFTLSDCIFLPQDMHAKLLQQVNGAITAAKAASAGNGTDAGTTSDTGTGENDKGTTGSTGTDGSKATVGESELTIPTDPSKVSDSITKAQAKEMLSILRAVIKWREALKPGHSYKKPGEKADKKQKVIYEAFTKFKGVDIANIKAICERLHKIIKATPEGKNVETHPAGDRSWSAGDYVFWGAIGALALITTGLIIRKLSHSPAEPAPAAPGLAPGRSGETQVIKVDRAKVDDSPLAQLKAKLSSRVRADVGGKNISHWTNAANLKQVTTIYQIAEISNESARVVLDLIQDSPNILLIIGNVDKSNVDEVCFAIFKGRHAALDDGITEIFKKENGDFYKRNMKWGNLNHRLDEKATAAASAKKTASRSSNPSGQVADELAARDALLLDSFFEGLEPLEDPKDTIPFPLRGEGQGEGEAPKPAAAPIELDPELLTVEDPTPAPDADEANKTVVMPAPSRRVPVVATAADQRAQDNLNAQKDVIAEFAESRPDAPGIGELTSQAAIANNAAELIDALRTGFSSAQYMVPNTSVENVQEYLAEWCTVVGVKKDSPAEIALILTLFDRGYPRLPTAKETPVQIIANRGALENKITARMETYNAVSGVRAKFARLQGKDVTEMRAGISALAKSSKSYTDTVEGKPQTFAAHFFVDGDNASAKIYFVDEKVYGSDEGSRETLAALAKANHPVILIVGDRNIFYNHTLDVCVGLLGENHPAASGTISEIVTKATPPAPQPPSPQPSPIKGEGGKDPVPQLPPSPPVPVPSVAEGGEGQGEGRTELTKPAPAAAARPAPAPAPMTLTLEQVLQLMKDFYQNDTKYEKAYGQLTFELTAAEKPEDILDALIEKLTGSLASAEDRDNFGRAFNRQYNFSTMDANTRFVRQMAVLMEALATGKDPLDLAEVNSIRAAAIAKANAIQAKMRADAKAARATPAVKAPPAPAPKAAPASTGQTHRSAPTTTDGSRSPVVAKPSVRPATESAAGKDAPAEPVVSPSPQPSPIKGEGEIVPAPRQPWSDARRGEPAASASDASAPQPVPAPEPAAPRVKTKDQILLELVKDAFEELLRGNGNTKFQKYSDAINRAMTVKGLLGVAEKMLADKDMGIGVSNYYAWKAKLGGGPDKVDPVEALALCIKFIGEAKGQAPGADGPYKLADHQTRFLDSVKAYARVTFNGEADKRVAKQPKLSAATAKPTGALRPAASAPRPSSPRDGGDNKGTGDDWWVRESAPKKPTDDGPSQPSQRAGTPSGPIRPPVMVKPVVGPQCIDVIYEGGQTFVDGNTVRVTAAEPNIPPSPPVGEGRWEGKSSPALSELTFTDFVKSLYSNNRQFYEAVLSHTPEQQLKDILLRMKALAKTDSTIKALYDDVNLTYEFIKAFNHENPGFFKEPEATLNLFVRSRFRDTANTNLRTLTADQFVGVYATRREAELQATRRVERETLALRGNLRRGMDRLEHTLREAERIRRR